MKVIRRVLFLAVCGVALVGVAIYKITGGQYIGIPIVLAVILLAFIQKLKGR